MFCLHSSCPPESAAFLPLRCPVPLWSSPPPPPAGTPGALQPSGHRPGSQDSSPEEGENSIGRLPSFPPSRTMSPSCKRRRPPGSAGQAESHFSSGPSLKSPTFKVEHSPEFPSQLDRIAATADSDEYKTDSLVIDFGSEIQEQWTNNSAAGEVESRIRNPEDLSPFRHVSGGRRPNARSPSCFTADCDDRPGSEVSARQGRLPSPLLGSPAPSSPKIAALKFGIDSILRTNDDDFRMANEVSMENDDNQRMSYHHHHHHHRLHLLKSFFTRQPPVSPLFRIRSQTTKCPGSSSNFVYTPPSVYLPHLLGLPCPPLPSSSSSSSPSSSSSSSPPSSYRLPSIHFSFHPPFHAVSNHRHPEFSTGLLRPPLLPPPPLPPPPPPQSKRKRSWSRAVFSNLQRKGLEKRFQVQRYVTKPDRRQLAAMLGLTDAQVKVWFQNRRMKWRHQEEATKKKDPEPLRAPIRHPGASPGGESEPPTEFHPHWDERRSSYSESDVESHEDDPDHYASCGGIHVTMGGGEAAVVSVTEILDLRKNNHHHPSAEDKNSASSTGNEDDDCADDDVIGVSMT